MRTWSTRNGSRIQRYRHDALFHSADHGKRIELVCKSIRARGHVQIFIVMIHLFVITIIYIAQHQGNENAPDPLLSLEKPYAFYTNATNSLATSSMTTTTTKIAFVVVVAFARRRTPKVPTIYKHALDGYAVLAESILQHYPHADLLILAHPSTASEMKQLEELGYFQILYRDHPVPLSEIENQTYVQVAETEPRKGCCGMMEFLKLHCYTLTDYDVVVHLDHDTLLKESVDDLIRVIMGKSPQKPIATHRNETIGPNNNNGDGVSFIFTRDYKGSNGQHDPTKVGVQGGFFMLRPSMQVFQEMQIILQRGHFSVEHGWEGTGIGNFYGDAQIQGFLAYYYYLHPRSALEVDRCIYNTVMEDETLRPDGTCLTNEVICQNCQETPWEELILLHFTMCTKPWTCQLPRNRRGDLHLCKAAHYEWFRLRRLLDEKQFGKETPMLKGANVTWGYCSQYGNMYRLNDYKHNSYTGINAMKMIMASKRVVP